MQLRKSNKRVWAMGYCLFSLSSYGQDSLSLKNDSVRKPIEIDILSSYYGQDGNHSPVTGGLGTEQLTDLTNGVSVYFPGEKKSVNMNLGADHITSASTDNIDFELSSDSKRDMRVHGGVGVTYKLNEQQEWDYGAGFSSEYDVKSLYVEGGGMWRSENKNRMISAHSKIFIDRWSLYRPVELSNNLDIDENEIEVDPSGHSNRYSFNNSFSYSQVITKRMQVMFAADFISQNGQLSTPFHRVFFNDGVDVSGMSTLEILQSNKLRRYESLPNNRTKVPVSARLHYYLMDGVVLKGFYRKYWDNFGVTSNTYALEVPISLSNSFTAYPFVRYHNQEASKYFAPFGEHEVTSEFYTSDFDLSQFSSTHYGFGLKYEPLFGVGRSSDSERGKWYCKSIFMRTARYSRTDGLNAAIVSMGASFRVF